MDRKTEQAYKSLVKELEKNKTKPPRLKGNYDGNQDESLHLKAALMDDIAKSFVQKHKGFSKNQWKELFETLSRGRYSEEKLMIGRILKRSKKLRRMMSPEEVDQWLDHTVGWLQVDTICQSVFKPEQFLENWPVWKDFLLKLSKDKNINKRRASLVLLTGPVRRSKDERLADLSFKIIDGLKREKDILITKAVSWLLRTLIKNHRNRVEEYLKRNKDSLPAIAVRETSNKLKKGTKN